MSLRRSLTITVSLLALLSIAFLPTFSDAKIQKGEKRPLLTRHLMKGVVKPFSGDLKKAIEAGDWEEVEMLAGLLNESSHVMMADGRCPDATWKKACDQLDAATRGVIAAAAKKDGEAAAAAAKGIGGSCGTCHKAHKRSVAELRGAHKKKRPRGALS